MANESSHLRPAGYRARLIGKVASTHDGHHDRVPVHPRNETAQRYARDARQIQRCTAMRGAGIAVLALTASFACGAQTSPAPQDFKGRWQITDIVGYGVISGGLPEAKELIGEVVTITAKSISFGKDACTSSHDFKASEVDTAPALDKYYGVTRGDTGLPARTQLLDSDNCAPVFQLDKDRVVLGHDGIVVRASRLD